VGLGRSLPFVAELGSGAAAGTAKEAAEQDLVVLAAHWASVQAALFSVGDWTAGSWWMRPTALPAVNLWR
jgi:predicted dinucleotide-binding enzyme